MHNSADAERARERLHGTVVEGRKIEVCMMLIFNSPLLELFNNIESLKLSSQCVLI